MKNEYQISDLVYEYFLMKIRFESYKFGDTLPTVDTLCREFCIGAQTVKAALRRLRAEGYISMGNGQFTKVLFKQTDKELAHFKIQYFSQRRSAFCDLCRTVERISIPLLIEGFRRTSEKELVYLSHYVERAHSDDLLYFYSYILQKLQNPLAMNLFWEISLFLGLMFIGENDRESLQYKKILQEGIRESLCYGKEQDWDGLRNALLRHQRNTLNQALMYVEQITPEKQQKQTPFAWRIYRGHPQLCYSLAIRILHEIYLGEYRNADYLPSYQKMAEKYRVSVSTVRRTIDVLNQIGATQSVNGVGTRIFPIGGHCNMPDFDSPAVRQNLAYFFQSFELIIYSCEETIRATLQASAPEELNGLYFQLKKNLEYGTSEFSLWHVLIYIAQNCPLQGIREIYSKIYGLFLWGYPLKASMDKPSELEWEDYRFTKAMMVLLQKRDFEQCSSAVKELVTRQFHVAEKYLLHHGIHPEELRLNAAINLLLTDEPASCRTDAEKQEMHHCIHTLGRSI